MKHFGTMLDIYMTNGYYVEYRTYQYPGVSININAPAFTATSKSIEFLYVEDGTVTYVDMHGGGYNISDIDGKIGETVYWKLTDDEVRTHILMEAL